jgi:threonine synthase
MDHITGLKCVLCDQVYAVHEQDYICPNHGNEGILDVIYDYGLIAKRLSRENLKASGEFSIWRYKPLLPVQLEASEPPLSVGWTPLYRSERLAQGLGLKNLWVKDDGRQATASFKDRASAIALLKAQEKGAEVITTASTGNAAAALSGLCASVGQKNVIFVPSSAPQAKLAQLLAFGSTVLLVEGSYDDAFDLCMQAADAYGWYNRNTGYNPYMSEGKKTASFEICEQLLWQAPDRIFVSVGDGCIIGGLHKGLKDLLALGWIDRMPKLMGVQAKGSNYLADAWEKGEDVLNKPPINATTIADSISAGLPRDRVKAMAAVRDTEGAFITVDDTEILQAIPSLASGCGVFAEPAGAAAYAGLSKAVATGQIDTDERIVVLNTGSGLKDVTSAMQAVQNAGSQPFNIKPDLNSLKQLVASWQMD